MKSYITSAIVASAILAAGSITWASPGHDSAKGPAGEAGKARDSTRTIEMLMHDNYYAPESIKVEKGETVRFVVRNVGDLVHEFAIGTPAMHAGHQKEMEAMMDRGILEVDRINRSMMKMGMSDGKTMEHSDPNSVLLNPGEDGEVVWKFSSDGNLQFACNVPGHYEAGMIGEVNLR